MPCPMWRSTRIRTCGYERRCGSIPGAPRSLSTRSSRGDAVPVRRLTSRTVRRTFFSPLSAWLGVPVGTLSTRGIRGHLIPYTLVAQFAPAQASSDLCHSSCNTPVPRGHHSASRYSGSPNSFRTWRPHARTPCRAVGCRSTRPCNLQYGLGGHRRWVAAIAPCNKCKARRRSLARPDVPKGVWPSGLCGQP